MTPRLFVGGYTLAVFMLGVTAGIAVTLAGCL